MSNGEESEKTGRETLTAVLHRLTGSTVGSTLRMRAALALAVLDRTVSTSDARLLGGLINGSDTDQSTGKR